MDLNKTNFGVEAPAKQAFSITPNDSVDLTQNTRGIYIGGAGDLKVLLFGDTTPVTFAGLIEGALLPICVKRVYATGTTAMNILGLY